MGKNGLVFAVERCSLHDGPGLRTTVFLKGCPLHCLWCHNPESQAFFSELFYLEEKCTGCGRCMGVCRQNCHVVSANTHEIRRNHCRACGECVNACPSSALEIKGRLMSAQEVMETVEKDLAYYIASGGGLTISGGEPMSQFEFTGELLHVSKEKGIHNCIETSGFAPFEKYMKIRDKVDIFLFDYKESDPERHRRFTGADPRLIMDNLTGLDKAGAKIVLRCPIIPGKNDRRDHFMAIAELSKKLTNILEINIMPYHPMGKSKSKRIGREYPLDEIDFSEKEQVDKWLGFIQENTDVAVKKG